MTILLESDFLTVSLKSITNNKNQTEPDTNTADEQNNQNDETSVKLDDVNKTYPSDFDWEEELKKRLEKNKQLDSESQESEYNIEKRFWYEYFNNGWGEAFAKQLLKIGDTLQDDIKVLGFKKQTNPIIAFLSLGFVKKELLATELLNSNTYQAIHTAVKNNLVADSEFFEASDYNILYCKDLYTKSIEEIITYLNYQKQNLSPSASAYTSAQRTKNKKMFIQIPENDATGTQDRAIKQMSIEKALSVKDAGAKLNSLDLVGAIVKIKPAGKNVPANNSGKENNGQATSNTASDVKGSKDSKVASDDKNVQKNNQETSNKSAAEVKAEDLNEVADRIKTKPQAYAVLQYLLMINNNEKAKKAVRNSKFDDITVKDLRNASARVAAFTHGMKLSKANTDALVDIIIGRLK